MYNVINKAILALFFTQKTKHEAIHIKSKFLVDFCEYLKAVGLLIHAPRILYCHLFVWHIIDTT